MKTTLNFFWILSIFLLSMIISSCGTSTKISNGAYSDLSLNLDSKQYSVKKLNEITKEEKAIFGIPTGKSSNKSQSIVFRFNGVTIGGGKKFLPSLSLVGLTLATGYAIQNISGYQKETVQKYGGYYDSFGEYQYGTYFKTENSDKHNLNLGISSILAFPIAGIINNQLWNSALGKATTEANNQLLQDNDDIDVFLNPKYDINFTRGLFTQNAKVRYRVMGAKILINN